MCEESKLSDGGLSIIIPVYNNEEDFLFTFSSMCAELKVCDEVIIVDSSSAKGAFNDKIFSISSKAFVKYIWTRPGGVFAAHNSGLSIVTKPWVLIINSGDSFKEGFRAIINTALISNKDVMMHVFAQESGFSRKGELFFYPSDISLWPHQSTVVAQKVYEEIGLYDDRYKVVADQVFFAIARKKFSYRIYDSVLTYYDLQGLSSNVSVSASQEIYLMWRALDRPIFGSVVKAVLPWIRCITALFIGKKGVLYLKRFFFSCYKL